MIQPTSTAQLRDIDLPLKCKCNGRIPPWVNGKQLMLSNLHFLNLYLGLNGLAAGPKVEMLKDAKEVDRDAETERRRLTPAKDTKLTPAANGADYVVRRHRSPAFGSSL
ncbi:Uncharacterized protein Adt_21357 [Abeliophyllum distichum]|uniref:Uncharacterized protein n=1 Tax=Abeliophyllum distichum TaxID=126358 RepID=A0ABD1SZC7_9LAMI